MLSTKNSLWDTELQWEIYFLCFINLLEMFRDEEERTFGNKESIRRDAKNTWLIVTKSGAKQNNCQVKHCGVLSSFLSILLGVFC